MKPQPKLLTTLSFLSATLLILALFFIVYVAPMEAVMNYVQKIFYFHIATAWVGMLGFAVAAISGIAYLARRNMEWDIIEEASVEISLIFFLIAIMSGSIWARPTWGTWWTWDARLTTAAVLEMIYLAYMILRQSIEEPERRARISAVYTLLGGLSVPVTFLSIRLWQTIHPAIFGVQNSGTQGSFGMTSTMLFVMFFCLITFSVIFCTLIWYRIRIGELARVVETLRARVFD